MSETTPLIKAALNLRVGAGFDVYEKVYAALFYIHIKVPVKPLNAVIQGLYGV